MGPKTYLTLIKINLLNLRELNSIGRDICILYAGDGVRTPATALLHN